MFGSIFELPTEVRNSFNPDDQEIFLREYNKFDPKTEEETRDALRKTWHKCKELPSAFTFKAIAGADIKDKDGEIILVDSIKKDMDKFLRENNGLMYEHGDYRCGVIWDWEPCTIENNIPAVAVYGALYGNNDVVREARRKFKKGLNNLSIAGEAGFGEYSCENGVCATRRPVKTIMEISLCMVPANKACRLISSHQGSNEGFAKSVQPMNMPFTIKSVHEATETPEQRDCPVCATRRLEKSLKDIGYADAEATYAGVRIKMDNMSFAKAYPHMEKNGLHAVRVGDSVYVSDVNDLIERSFKDGYKDGYISKEGLIMPKITKSQFQMLCERDVLENRDGKFYLKRLNSM